MFVVVVGNNEVALANKPEGFAVLFKFPNKLPLVGLGLFPNKLPLEGAFEVKGFLNIDSLGLFTKYKFKIKKKFKLNNKY